MDIRCPSCGTTYEFDTSQFGREGVNVRCSACKAVFRVAASSSPAPVAWYALRPTTGVTIEAAEMVALQRLVMQGQVAGDDLISSDRVNWQRADTLESLRPFLSINASLGQSSDSTRTIGRLSRTSDAETPYATPAGAGSASTNPPGATPFVPAQAVVALPSSSQHTTHPAPPISSGGTFPVAALDDAATRNMHPLSDEQLGDDTGGRITSTASSVTPRPTSPIREDGRSTTAVSPATIASQRLHPIEQVTSPTPSLPHSIGPDSAVPRQNNPAFSTAQFSAVGTPPASTPAHLPAPSAPSPRVAPQPPAPPVGVAPSTASATQVLAVHDVDAVLFEQTNPMSRQVVDSAVATIPRSTPPSGPAGPVAATPRPAPPSTPPAAGRGAVTQAMHSAPAAPSGPPPLMHGTSGSAPIPAAAAAAIRQQTHASPPAQPARQVLRPTGETSPPPSSRPAVQLQALRSQSARKLDDRYTLGRSGLAEEEDGWKVGDEPLDFPPEPGDGRSQFNDTLEVERVGGRNPVLTLLLVVAVLAVGGLAAVLITQPELLSGLGTNAEGSAAIADGSQPESRSGSGGSAEEASTVGVAVVEGSADPSEAAVAEASAEVDAGEASVAPPEVVAGADVPVDAGTPPEATPAAPRNTPAQPIGDDYDALMARAERALSARRYNDAVDLFSTAADESNRAEAHVGAGRAYAGMGQWHIAVARYQRAIDRNARYMPAWYELGNARRQSGDTSGAIEAWQRVVDESRDPQLVQRAQSAIDGVR